jgi:hypothetical protein
MEKIVITRPHQIVASLAELAVQINAEHGNVEAAIRDGLAHARQAGALLLQAKAKVSHGDWLLWLEQNCKATPRTAQRYMELSQHWEEVIAMGGETLGLHGTLKLLHQKDDPDGSNATRASHLPATLAFYHDNGFINEDVLAQLLDLAPDYGPEIITTFPFSEVQVSHEGDWFLLNLIRPLDHPPLWPFPRHGIATPGNAAVATATRIFIEDGRARGAKVAQWELTAFWFASTMVHFADAFPEFVQRFASILHNNLAAWRESFRTALVMVARLPPHVFLGDEEDAIWWGYHSDLRHAGVIRAAEELATNPGAYPALFQSSEAGFADWKRLGSYPMPSCKQGRLNRFTADETESIAEGAQTPVGPTQTAQDGE